MAWAAISICGGIRRRRQVAFVTTRKRCRQGCCTTIGVRYRYGISARCCNYQILNVIVRHFCAVIRPVVGVGACATAYVDINSTVDTVIGADTCQGNRKCGRRLRHHIGGRYRTRGCIRYRYRVSSRSKTCAVFRIGAAGQISPGIAVCTGAARGGDIQRTGGFTETEHIHLGHIHRRIWGANYRCTVRGRTAVGIGYCYRVGAGRNTSKILRVIVRHFRAVV